MKKIIFGFAFLTLALISCEDDTLEFEEAVVLDIATQNSYDDTAIAKFLDEHYLDSKGNINEFNTVVVPSVDRVKLSSLNPITLPSGVVYIKRANAQPNPGKSIAVSDSLKLMSLSTSYLARSVDNVIGFTSPQIFSNTIGGSGIPQVDPLFYYVSNNILVTNPSTSKSYFEIEGFGEALRNFSAFDIPDSNDYNLQGVIIVPSRAAFAKDPYFDYVGGLYGLNDRSFVFNFQVYKSITRPKP